MSPLGRGWWEWSDSCYTGKLEATDLVTGQIGDAGYERKEKKLRFRVAQSDGQGTTPCDGKARGAACQSRSGSLRTGEWQGLWAFKVSQAVKNLPAMQETRV